MRRLYHWLALASSIAALGTAADAYGNDRGIRGTMVAPVSCIPVSPPETIKFVGNGWISAQYVEGKIACQLPLNAVDLGATTDDNDITKFRIHYSFESIYDSIKVGLYKTKVAGGWAVESIVCETTLRPTVVGAGTKIVACPHDVAGDGTFYSFVVVLAPLGTGRTGFFGIDFPK